MPTHVFLEGDSFPICTPLSPEAIAVVIQDAFVAAGDMDGVLFVRIPFEDGRSALVRPQKIVAMVPADDDEEDE